MRKADYKIFGRLREILENRDKNSRDVVEGKMRRFLRTMEEKATREKKYAPLNKLGFDTDLATMLSSVSHETYKKCMEEYEMRKEDDRIRKRGNHDPDSALKVVEEMNERVALGHEK